MINLLLTLLLSQRMEFGQGRDLGLVLDEIVMVESLGTAASFL